MYIYSVQLILEKVIAYAALLALSVIFNVTIQTVIFILFFSNIRRYSGGFHLKYFYTCFIFSSFLYILWVNIICPRLGDYTKWSLLGLLITGSIILILGAVNNPYICWDKSEHKKNSELTRLMILIELFIAVALYFIKIDDSYLWYISFAVTLSAASLIIEKIKRRKFNNEEF